MVQAQTARIRTTGKYNHARPRLDEAGGVLDDVACIRCGYSLRGAPYSGACPECSLSTVRTFMGNYFECSEPSYVAALGRGAALIACSCVALMVLPSIIIVFGLVISPLLEEYSQSFGVLENGLTYLVVLHPAFICLLAGLWLYGRPDPVELSVGGEVPRRVMRWSACASAVAWMFLIVIGFTALGRAFRWYYPPVFLMSFGAAAASLVCSILYTRSLVPRIPNLELLAHAGRLRWAMPALCVFLFFVLQPRPLVYTVVRIRRFSGPNPVFPYACIMILPLIAMGWYIYTINALRKDLWVIRRSQRTLEPRIVGDPDRPRLG